MEVESEGKIKFLVVFFGLSVGLKFKRLGLGLYLN